MHSLNTEARAFLLPRLRDVLFVSVFIAVLFLGPIMLNLDGDLPRHLLTGKFILETKTVPSTEPFAYPYQGKPYVSHEWLADVIFYLVYKYTRLAGIAILSALLLATTFCILYTYTSSISELRFPTLILVIWGAAATSLNWVTRPHLISMLFLTICLIWLDKLVREEKKIKLWLFPLLMLIWSNMHGEFIAGMLAMLAYLVGWIWDYLFTKEPAKKSIGKNLFFATGLSFLASLINPAGFGPWKTLIGFVNNSYLMSRMYEARPPDFSQPEFMVLLGLLAFSIFILAIKKYKISTSQAFLLAGFSAMSLMAGRNVHLYGIVAPFVLAGAVSQDHKFVLLHRLENSIRSAERNLRGIVWPLIAIAASILALSGKPAQKLYNFDPNIFPVNATKWIMMNPQQGNMFNDLNWGGYLALHLWPEQSVFVDSMADTTGELTSAYESVITLSSNRKAILSEYQVEWAVIQSSSLLAGELEAEGWATLYEDDTAVIFRSNSAP